MASVSRILTLTALLIIGINLTSHAATGDMSSVVSHDQRFVVTDPSKGFNSYSNWVEFPSDSTTYRKLMLNITYECPDGLHCGQWDYIDNVFLRQVGSASSDTLNIELARIISPYGWRFDSTWSFTWSVDITDFSLLLHDSALIDFIHTGYESADDRGWLVSLEFEITEGRPAIEILAMDTLWCGRFPYGDTALPIETLLQPIAIEHPEADFARLRIHQTGHGMDSYENCAEFCKKYRRVHFDGELIDWRELWRECGDNPLYPQAGTWIFDRANWCPGQVVFPDIVDHAITPDSTHYVDIEMQHYQNTEEPTANWSIYSYLFYAKKPWAKNDVTLEEIIVPSFSDQNSRVNPSCSGPVVRIKNSGSDTLRSVNIWYGQSDVAWMYLWKGALAPQASKTVDIPHKLEWVDGSDYHVELTKPNGVDDEYKYDNKLTAPFELTPGLPSEFIVAFTTNNEPDDNFYQIVDAEGRVIGGRAIGTMEPATRYHDEYKLADGCYQLIVADTVGYGLELWFNPEGGYGSVRILDEELKLIKSFDSDFGSGVKWSFNVGEGELMESDSVPLVNIFPPRNAGQFEVHLFYNDSTDIAVSISHDSLGTVYENSYTKIKDEAVAIDISDQPDGSYNVNVTANGATVTRKVRLRHAN